VNETERGAASGSGAEPADKYASMREQYRQQMLASIGGWSGALITAIPTAVFVIVNVVSSLWPAIYAATGSALLLTGYRLARRKSVQQALSGLFGVLIAAIIAARTGQARGYFLVGIWTSFLYAAPFAISVLVRRPLVGVLWEFLDPTPTPKPSVAGSADAGPAPEEAERPWRSRRPLLVAYTWATIAATIVFLARGIVQLTLYQHHQTGWLGFTKVAMGYPLFIVAVGFAFLVVTRARKRVAAGAD
jgi:hypothetical protein